MLGHSKCGYRVKAVLNESIAILGDIEIGTNGVQVNGISFYNIGNGSKTVNYYCERCKKEVPAEDVVFNCYRCGNNYPLDTVNIPEESGGNYCETCAKKLGIKEREKMVDVNAVKNILITSRNGG